MSTSLLALVLLVPVPAQDAPTVEPFELTVRRAVRTPGVEVFGEPGVQVKIALRTPGRTILSIDRAATRLERWVDDAGSDLAGGADQDFFFWAQVEGWGDERGDATVVTLVTKSLPAPGSKTLALEATLGLNTASQTRQETVPLSLKDGATLTVAGIPLEVSDVSDEGGDPAMSFSLQSEQSLDAIRSVSFLDGDGQEIDSESLGSGSFGFGDKMTYSRTFGLGRKVERVQLRVSYWADLKTLAVPVALKLGVGL